MQRKHIFEAGIWLFGVFVAVVVKKFLEYAFGMSNWTGTGFFIAAGGVLFCVVVCRTGPALLHRIRSGELDYDKLAAILDSYKTVSGCRCFTLNDEDEDVVKQRLLSLGRFDHLWPWRRPMVFHTYGLRDKVFWVDYVYLSLLSDLAGIGFDVRVIVHAELHNPPGSASARSPHVNGRSKRIQSYIEMIRRSLRYGDRISFSYGLDLAKRSRKLRNRYIDLVYNVVAPYLVTIIENMVACPKHQKFAHHEVLNLLDGLVIFSMPKRKLVIGLYWERQARKWTLPPLSGIKDDLGFRMLHSDVVVPQPESSNVWNPADAIYLLDDPFVLQQKILRAHDSELLSIAKVLLGLKPREYIWQERTAGQMDDTESQELLEVFQQMYPLANDAFTPAMLTILKASREPRAAAALRPLLSQHECDLSGLYLRLGVFQGVRRVGDHLRGQTAK